MSDNSCLRTACLEDVWPLPSGLVKIKDTYYLFQHEYLADIYRAEARLRRNR